MRVLINGRSSKSLMTKKASRGLEHVSEDSSEWKTTSSAMSTNSKTKVKMMLPGFNSTQETVWKFHVTEDLLNCDAIGGRDPFKELGVILDFSKEIMKWEESWVPVVDVNTATKELVSHMQKRGNTVFLLC